jgi:hypothetical protein
VTQKLGRPLGRPRSRASFLGHPGTSAGEGWARLPPPPGPPPPRTAPGGGGLLTLTLRGKAMDGFEEQQERNRPQLCPPSLGNRRTDAGFPQASTGRRRSVACRSLGLLFTTNGTYNRQKSDAGNTVNPSTQSGQVQTLGRGRVNVETLLIGMPSLLPTASAHHHTDLQAPEAKLRSGLERTNVRPA